MKKRQFGNTGIEVSVLGLGGGQVGSDSLSDADADRFLNTVLDLGITLIDTARMYGHSEERIGKYISHRRDEYILSSKCGYTIPGYEDWTYDCVIAGVDRALDLMKTDRVDIMHLHSCPKEVLERGDVIQALEDVVKAGKVRFAAYSGENEALEYAIGTGRFASLQTSVNFCDQRGISQYLPEATQRGMGVIAKRPLANAPWLYDQRPVGQYVEVYWERFHAMGLPTFDLPWDEVALRFAAFAPGVSSIISGTAKPDHIRRNAEILAKGPLPEPIIITMTETYASHGDCWPGQI
ncbi:MAG: aldo/keto reductase [Candidatus Sumerlaeaceae bacterium]|nr:aldo/keto reductase [Candidatus Sumerlaeaceae bacterium]